MNKKDYTEWINARLADFQHNFYGKESLIKLINEYRRTISISFSTRLDSMSESCAITYNNFIISWDFHTRLVTIFNTITHKYGQAKAANEDDFSIIEGIAIAWAKYNNMPIPSIEKTISRDILANGDSFISSVNKSSVVTFIGWIPNTKDGLIGKWAIILNENGKPLKTQIAKEIVKLN